MKSRTTYKTKQSDFILEYLKENTDKQLSINQIADAIGNYVGKSTIYRRISEMTNNGVIRRFRGNDGKSVVYQFVGEDHECDKHFHLKCMDCGKLIHLECWQMDEIAGHIGKKHGFSLDSTKCVLYGKCARCVGGDMK